MTTDPNNKNVTFKWFKGADGGKNANSTSKRSHQSGSGNKSGNNGTNDGIKSGSSGGRRKEGMESNEIASASILDANDGVDTNLIHSSHESMSTLVVNPSSYHDFTTYYCYGKNSIGWSRDPCAFNLIQSGNNYLITPSSFPN